MAKMADTKIIMTMDADTKRVIRSLTKAVEKLARTMQPYRVEPSIQNPGARLTEPAEDANRRVDKIVQIFQEADIEPGTPEDWEDTEFLATPIGDVQGVATDEELDSLQSVLSESKRWGECHAIERVHVDVETGDFRISQQR